MRHPGRAALLLGANDEGQLGVGDTEDRTTPAAVEGDGWAESAIGELHSCARRLDGSLWCWGANGEGQLEIGSAASEVTPALVRSASGAWATPIRWPPRVDSRSRMLGASSAKTPVMGSVRPVLSSRAGAECGERRRCSPFSAGVVSKVSRGVR
ncbi:hypothetical protein [Sorangium sp. So ce145]|uniref:hypothetical protein n=1 Tax=Sorangium sp. So ce145 TaxID=3133285 RepID=UPI003F5DC291